jgi:DNA adenine methylase
MSYTFTKSNRYPYLSPLRYPGGKAILYPLLKDLVELNCTGSAVYCEPYAGGAGAALELLFNGYVEQIKLNDKDVHIFAFWHVLLNDTHWLVDRISEIKVTMPEWHRQRTIFDNYQRYTIQEVGFATFFLNRSNRGGILLKAGPIGGLEQQGKYAIDARFGKDRLIDRVLHVAARREQITFENSDAYDFMQARFKEFRNTRLLMYIDPPYYKQGASLYLNHYHHSDHSSIASLLLSRRHRNWVLSYDNEKPILDLYASINKLYFNLRYSLQTVSIAKEIMAFSDSIEVPDAVSSLFLASN